MNPTDDRIPTTETSDAEIPGAEDPKAETLETEPLETGASTTPADEPPPYEPPAIVLERRIEAVANTCAFDPPLTKSNAFEGCTGVTFS